MKFQPVRTLAELDTLDEEQMMEGYLEARPGDPEPGPNRGKSYWHGWRNRMMDYGEIPHDDASWQLVGEYVARQRSP